MELKWYIVHTYSGFEKRVKKNLEERIKAKGQEEYFGDILVPTEQVIELKKGERRTSSRRFFPGYILVQMALNKDTWHTVRYTPKVTGFVGGDLNPRPVSEEEVQKIVEQMKESEVKPRSKYNFEEGDEVRVIDGPFTNFQGVVEEVSPEKERLKVSITIFGRATPVWLDFIQVTKI